MAARALGVSNRTIMFRHLLPNAMVATMTFLPFIVSSSVMTLTALDFLGFGLPPGSPSLGELLSQGKANVQAPWLGLCGFMTVAFMLSLLIFIGEAVRDAFDPRKTFRCEINMSDQHRCSRFKDLRRLRVAAGSLASTKSPSTCARARPWRWSASPGRVSPPPRSPS